MTSSSIKYPINGILLINKPQGLTSNAVLQKVKRLLNARKAGHTGSLDPLATGMLPICFGEATKVCQYLLEEDKCYEVEAVLGIKTNTADATGEVIAQTENFSISEENLVAALTVFSGDIKQIPSMFSALKHQGIPLYKYARAGVNIERAARDISIRHLQLDHFDGKRFKLTVLCSKGTYIRNLVEDIGDYLGAGAHVAQLHRRYTANFSAERMFTLEELTDCSFNELSEYLLPIDRALQHFPLLVLSPQHVQKLYQGQTIQCEDTNNSGYVRLYDNHDQFIGIGEITEMNTLKVKRLLSQENA